jgi:aryl-alcohol dehydrogenase-like predicted oxidoreductase
MALDPTPTALGAWSGGRFLHFGEPLDDDRLVALLTPGDGIDTVITADVYGQGEGDVIVGRAIRDTPRADFCLVGAVGHDFYTGERQGAKGFPRFTATTPPPARPSAAAWTPSTCCCCTTPIAPATATRASGRACRPFARPA